ncbi:hypothetical protein F0562_013131 [Nyssa sinensis]|uniref:Beta-glucosidase n=1 Tax=Nyssa sinensis TaxID=561372 RepID=A0A5J4ZXR9_9ASTE|nr:hypothetical protein F0562_013131 [Nyssa sinensis]
MEIQSIPVSVHGPNSMPPPPLPPHPLTRRDFPPDFIFGAGSSPYQTEGAAKEGDKIADGSNGNVTVDVYHRYKEDVSIMKKMGLDSYRFAISWTRILPSGRLCGGVNKEGVKYYNNLIDELLANGLIFAIMRIFALGNLVIGSSIGTPLMNRLQYTTGRVRGMAQNHIRWHTTCFLLTAAVIELYRSKYQTCQKGKIGITLNTLWFEPFSEHPNDIKAAERALDFNLGWFLEPMINGHYPQSMRHNVKQRLPYFNHVQSNMLKGSCDFIGINYYTARYAKDAPHAGEGEKPSYNTDIKADLLSERDKVPIGPQGAPDWLYIYPEGIYKLLVYVKDTYRNPLVYLTENGNSQLNNLYLTINHIDPALNARIDFVGVGEANDAKLILSKALIDVPRIDYIDKHLRFLQAAIHTYNITDYQNPVEINPSEQQEDFPDLGWDLDMDNFLTNPTKRNPPTLQIQAQVEGVGGSSTQVNQSPDTLICENQFTNYETNVSTKGTGGSATGPTVPHQLEGLSNNSHRKEASLQEWIPRAENFQGVNQTGHSQANGDQHLNVINPQNSMGSMKNGLYDPMYAEYGLPVDPHLRLFMEKQWPVFEVGCFRKLLWKLVAKLSIIWLLLS